MEKIKNKLLENKLLLIASILMVVLFFGMDILLRRVFIGEFAYYSIFRLSPNLFTLGYIFIFLFFIFSLPKKGKIIFFNFFSIFFFAIFIAQYFHYKILGRAIVLQDIFLAGDAAGFSNFITSHLSLKFIVSCIFFIALIVVINICLVKYKKSKFNWKLLIPGVILFVVFQMFAIFSLGKALGDGLGEVNSNPKNIYLTYDNSSRALLVSGIYKYVERNIYLYVKEEFFGQSREDIIKKLDKYKKKYGYSHEQNDKTGIFKGKSVLYVLLESIDSYLITKEDTPNLYKMQQEGFNFTNRYAPTFGGGMTFNSEFSMITGMYQPLKGTASTKYVDNSYPYSFPSIFRKQSYSSNSIHANTSTFYNRAVIHKSFGFENHYGDLNEKYDEDFWYDSNLVSNEDVYNLLIPDGKFANYLATISAHGSYNEVNTKCEGFLEKYPQYKKIEDKELACMKAGVKETDTFFGELFDKLEKEGRLDDVVFVVATDHDAYGYEKTPEIKGLTDANELQKVPFMIYNSEIKGEQVDKIVDTADILPTLANMLDIDYSPTFSIGEDIFSESHKNYAFFNDGSYIDESGHHFSGEKDKNSRKILKEIQDLIKINKLILDSDYYR